MDVLKFFTVRLCPWDMHLNGRRKRRNYGTLQKLGGIIRAGPRGVVYGGALQAEDLYRAVQAVSGVRKPLLIGWGSGGAPLGNFLKSMSLRMHFRPF